MDLDAVHAWLRTAKAPATYRAYRKEAERLLLWAMLIRKRAISSMTVEDAQQFAGFLSSVPPADWVGLVDRRDSAQWRPFRGKKLKDKRGRVAIGREALSTRSVKHAITIVSSLFSFLVRTGYLKANPFTEVRLKEPKAADWANDRAFTQSEWARLRRIALAYAQSPGVSEAQAVRLRFVLEFLQATGLRLSELARAELRDLRTDKNGVHWLTVIGKGNVTGHVPVPPSAYRELMGYLKQRGLGPSARMSRKDEPLLASVHRNRTSKRLRLTQTASLCKRFFAFAAKRTTGLEFQAKLQAATTHWLRHTYATRQVESNVLLSHVRDNLRHKSIATTSRYVHADRDARARSVNKVFR